MKDKYLLGVTGLPGCGKSYVCRTLVEIGRERGINILYLRFDDERTKLMNNSPEYTQTKLELEDIFGPKIINNDGSISEKILYPIIYNNQVNMDIYRLITSKSMAIQINKKIQKEGIHLIEWGLFVEDNLLQMANDYLVINCSPSVQTSRLKKRLNTKYNSLKQIKDRINLQLTNSEKIARIQEYQKNISKGKVYFFNTTDKPDKNQYANLLEQIIAGIGYE